MRLDIHLTKKYPNFSRSHIQKFIKSGAVLVNNKIVKPHYEIKLNDKITEKITPPEKIDLSPDKSIKLEIIYEDKNYLVINKPAGLVVHPSESVKTHTLVNGLLAHYSPIKNIGDKTSVNNKQSTINNRPGIVHRLDKDASGLMVIAKTQPVFNDLKRQFKNHEIKKEYTCLVHGNVKKNSGEINIAIGRSRKGYKMSTRSQPKKKDKTAITKFKVLKRINPGIHSGVSNGYTLLKIQTLTGRTHQIRVHLHAIGHPITGDPIYQSKTSSIINYQLSIINPRLFLHADLLEFRDLRNQVKKFELPIPKNLNKFLLLLN